MVIFIIVLGACVLVDLLSKYLLTGRFFNLIPGVLSVHYVENRGAAFSIFYGNTVFLIVISSVLIVGLATFYFWSRRRSKIRDQKPSRVFDIGFAFFIGGALGNLVDRVFLGYVRDFIRLDFMTFPIFNLADVFINIGVILIVTWVIFLEPRQSKTKP